jgi:hypothetical protein
MATRFVLLVLAYKDLPKVSLLKMLLRQFLSVALPLVYSQRKELAMVSVKTVTLFML